MSEDFGAQALISDCLSEDARVLEYVKRGVYQTLTDGLMEHWLDKPVAYQVKSYTDYDHAFQSKIYRLRARAISIEYKQVYVPIYSNNRMPVDVFECRWCNGYTHNDTRGNCAACGAPRNEESFTNPPWMAVRSER